MRRWARWGIVVSSALAVVASSRVSRADPPAAHARAQSCVVLPTVAGEGASPAAAREMDAALADAAQDLGLAPDLRKAAVAGADKPKRESELAELAKKVDAIVIAPSVRGTSKKDEVEVTIALAEPGNKSLRVRSDRVALDDVAVRAVVLLRDVVSELASRAGREAPRPADRSGAAPAPVVAAKSVGRPILLTNAALFGGLVGFSIQKSAGSDDPRLLYPLLAVGAGVGLGASLVVSEEWDVGTGDAWFLAGAWWPTLAGHLIYEGRFNQDPAHPAFVGDRFAFGIIGGTTGITLATLGVALHKIDDGGALLAHSGGAFGLVFGGLVESAARGDIHRVPWAGAGYGAALGWLAASATATQIKIAPSRVLFLDLGAALGGFAGAALASPFLFGEVKEGKQRAFVAITLSAGVAGAGVAALATRSSPPVKSGLLRYGLPTFGVLGESVIGARTAPILGLSYGGAIR